MSRWLTASAQCGLDVSDMTPPAQGLEHATFPERVIPARVEEVHGVPHGAHEELEVIRLEGRMPTARFVRLVAVPGALRWQHGAPRPAGT